MPDKEDDNTNKMLWGVGSKSLGQGVDGRGMGLKRCNKENTRHLCVVTQPIFHSLRRRAQSKKEERQTGGEETSYIRFLLIETPLRFD